MVAIACSRGTSGQDPPPPTPPPAAATDAPVEPAAGGTDLGDCTRVTVAASVPVAEASGAVFLADGTILVVSDSGNDGAYVVIDAGDGHVVESGKLPLGASDGASRADDIEGLSRVGTKIWGLTSSGWVRAWERRADGPGFTLVVPAYRIDDEDACAVDTVNCGNNYEGLCLAPTAAAAAALGGCVGYAASKATGDLVCLVADGDRWRADPARRLHVSNPEALADCDVAADGTIWTGDNLFGRNAVHRIAGGAIVATGHLGEGFPEVITVGPDGRIYRFSDMGGAPSRVAVHDCAKRAQGGGGR